MLNSSGIKLALFLGLSALGHSLLLYPWSAGKHYQVVAGHDGSFSVAIVARPPQAQQQHSKPRAKPTAKIAHAANQDSNSDNVDKESAQQQSRESSPTPDRNRILAEINSTFKDHFYYPPQALRFGIEGQVLLGFEVYGDGSIHNIKVLRSSGSSILDNAAVDAITQMGSLPQLQAQLFGNTLTIELPVRYQRI